MGAREDTFLHGHPPGSTSTLSLRYVREDCVWSVPELRGAAWDTYGGAALRAGLDFARSELQPEPFSRFYQRSRYQAMRGLTSQVLHALRRRLGDLPGSIRREGRQILEREDRIVARFRWLLDRTVPAYRIRCHGNYHLQQILYRGDEFTVIDFEGEPRRSLGERRLKRSPLHDVASMLRSFDYAARRALTDRPDGATAACARNRSTERQWARFWRDWVCAAFLREYAGIASREQLVPRDPGVFIPLLDVYLLERAIYELG